MEWYDEYVSGRTKGKKTRRSPRRIERHHLREAMRRYVKNLQTL